MNIKQIIWLIMSCAIFAGLGSYMEGKQIIVLHKYFYLYGVLVGFFIKDVINLLKD